MAWTCKKCGFILPGINPVFVTYCPKCKISSSESSNEAPKMTQQVKQEPPPKKDPPKSNTTNNIPNIDFATTFDYDLERTMFAIMLLTFSGKDVAPELLGVLFYEFCCLTKDWVKVQDIRNAEWKKQTSAPLPYLKEVNQAIKEVGDLLMHQREPHLAMRAICKYLISFKSPSKIVFLTGVSSVAEPILKSMSPELSDALFHILVLAGASLTPDEVQQIRARYRN